MPAPKWSIYSSFANPKLDRRQAVIAWAAWWLVAIIVAILVWRRPEYRNECLVYKQASHDWWAGVGLYSHNHGIDGYLYFPQAALLYAPFATTGPAGDVLWRAAGMALFAWGLARLARRLSVGRSAALFAIFTLVALPPALSSIRAGQANLHIAAMMLHTTLALEQKRWREAAFWLVVGTLLKPIMLVMLLLAAVWYWRLIPRLALGLVLGVLLPFAFQRSHYVMAQYSAFWHATEISANPDREFCNLHGLLATTLGWTLSGPTFQIIGLVAAVGTLAAWLWVAPRHTEPARALYLLAWSVSYQLLFNPRTMPNSYVMLGPLLGIAVILASVCHRRQLAGVLIVMIVCLTCDGWAHQWTDNWLKPIDCIIFTIMLLSASLRRLNINGDLAAPPVVPVVPV